MLKLVFSCKETLPVMSFDNKCLLKKFDSKATINRTFIESGGPIGSR
jgi:hypothetical protein